MSPAPVLIPDLDFCGAVLPPRFCYDFQMHTVLLSGKLPATVKKQISDTGKREKTAIQNNLKKFFPFQIKW